MKKIYTVVSILACLTFHACDNSKESMNNNVVDEAFPEFTAMIGESDTKTSLKGLDVIWSDDDRVAIFNGTVRAKEYKVKAGYSGSTTTILTPVNQDFTAGTEGSEMDGNVAFYPYSAVRSCKKTDDGYTLTVNFPENIESSPSSVGMGVMPMVAVDASKMDYNLSFKNLCGLLKLQLKGNGVKIYSITLEGNSNEKLLGMAEIRLFNNKTPEIRYEGTRTNQIKEICDEGIQLNDSKDIYIPIAPIEFTCGITVRIVTDEGEIVKATNKPIKVERSIITPMQVIDVAAELDKVSVIKYTSIDDNIVNVSWTDYTTEKKWIRSNYYLNNHGIITFDRKLEEIPQSIFSGDGTGCESTERLTSVIIPKGVKRIRMYAFEYCKELKEVTLPEGLEEIDGGAFMYEYKLEKINIPESIKKIGNSAFWRDESLKNIEIPEGITSLEGFAYCRSLESFTIPKSIYTITTCLFEGCDKLKKVTLHDDITKIDARAFWGCVSLIDFEIPKGVTEIGNRAFYWTRLQNLYVYAINPPVLGEEVFITNDDYIPDSYYNHSSGDRQSDAILYVPAESIEAYKAADGWKDFKDIRAL